MSCAKSSFELIYTAENGRSDLTPLAYCPPTSPITAQGSAEGAAIARAMHFGIGPNGPANGYPAGPTIHRAGIEVQQTAPGTSCTVETSTNDGRPLKL